MRSWCVKLGGCLLVTVLLGCRTLNPDLKPPKQPEVLASPPAEARYDSPLMPREAYANTYNPLQKSAPAQPGMPGRGGMGPSMARGN
jgi:hypothetical protein